MRILLRLNLRRLRLRGLNIKKLLLIGNGPRAEWLAKQVSERTDFGYRLVGYVDEERRLKDPGSFSGAAGWVALTTCRGSLPAK